MMKAQSLDEDFSGNEQLQIVENLRHGRTDDCVNEVIMKLTDDFMD